MREFDALVHSLGEHSVQYLKPSNNLSQLYVFGDELTGTAHIEVVLSDSTWEQHAAVIDRMIEIREMFLNDISIDYIIVDDDDRGDLHFGQPREADYVAA